jgi:hypothetical protein
MKQRRNRKPSLPIRLLSRYRRKTTQWWKRFVRFIRPAPRTQPGEIAFEQYLRENKIRFTYEKVWRGKRKRPDYTIRRKPRPVILDVKELTTDVNHFPYDWIREKINVASEQFSEFKDCPCAIVMFCNNLSLVHLKTSWIVLGGMYGNYGISIPFNNKLGRFDGDEASTGFLKNGKMMQPHWSAPQNTTISALITLQEINVGLARTYDYYHRTQPRGMIHYDPDLQAKVSFNPTETHYGVIVWENEYAAVPFPRDFFTGPYDERWGSNRDGKVKRIFRGEKLAEVRAIYPEAVSPLWPNNDDDCEPSAGVDA